MGGGAAAVASIPADVATFGGNILATPAEIAAGAWSGARIGSWIGWGIGSIIDDINSNTVLTEGMAEQSRPPKIEGFTDHGFERMQEAGLRQTDLNEALSDPQPKQSHETTMYVGKTATVVLNENNWVVTVWRTGTHR